MLYTPTDGAYDDLLIRTSKKFPPFSLPIWNEWLWPFIFSYPLSILYENGDGESFFTNLGNLSFFNGSILATEVLGLKASYDI